MIVTLLLIAAIAAGLTPLILRDLRRSAGRAAARRFWAEIHTRLELDLEHGLDDLPQFRREHLNWWSAS